MNVGLRHPKNSVAFLILALGYDQPDRCGWKWYVSLGTDPSLIQQGFDVSSEYEPTWGESNAQERRLKPCGPGVFADCAHLNSTAQQGANWCRTAFWHLLWLGNHHVLFFFFFTCITRRKSNHLSIILWEFLFFFICCVSFCRHNNLFVHSWWLLLFITTLYWLCVIQTSSWNKKRITCMLKDLLWGKPNLIRGVYSTEQQAFM